MKRITQIFFLLLLITNSTFSQSQFLLGNENLLKNYKGIITNQRIALLINGTSLLQNKTPLLDTLLKINVNVVKIFTPEHGFNLTQGPGAVVNDSTIANSIPVISIYGKKKSPSQKDLENVDAIIYDIQDVGARFYTYISSLKLTMKAAARAGIKIIVLDRPNPQNADRIEGEILEPKFSSFVGIAPIPILYGMTIGELAKFFKENIQIKENLRTDLTVIPMINYKREKFFNYYFTNWIRTSPNIRTYEAAFLYPGLCFLEATNISEGRGTDYPFEQFGAPFLKSETIIPILKKEFPKLKFETVKFTPVKRKNSSVKFAGKLCNGIKIKILDKSFRPVVFGIKLLKILKANFPSELTINYNWLNKLYGNSNLEKCMKNQISEIKLWNILEMNQKKFSEIRKRYLIY